VTSDQVRIYHFWGPCRDAEVRIEIGDLLNHETIRVRGHGMSMKGIT
jgi:hypothetical protein